MGYSELGHVLFPNQNLDSGRYPDCPGRDRFDEGSVNTRLSGGAEPFTFTISEPSDSAPYCYRSDAGGWLE